MFIYFNGKIVNADTIDYISCQALELGSLRVQFKNGKSETVEHILEIISLMILLHPVSLIFYGLGKCSPVKNGEKL